MNVSIDHFESAKLQIERGREHIKDAETRIKAFFSREPYATVVDKDAQTGQQSHKIRLTEKLPPNVRGIVKDASSNLRDALDHAVYANAVALIGGDPSDTGFPFANDDAGVTGELNGRRLRGNPVEIRPLLASFKPYPAGNQLLCALNRVRNPNTHRVIVPIGAAAIGAEFKFGEEIRGPVQIGINHWDASKNEVTYLIAGAGSKVQYEVKASFNVVFGEVDLVAGQPVIATLYAIASETERVILAIEAETARILRDRAP
ncbi:hypothetical protein [Mesorhizobium sp.]|uniref:hypothetical protein n=1 Tax=Mesorhizobium sp. TaxID=1871066 RepID=UPI000FE3B0C1|nr:hypothetical protein [Mesorhizobium sp.]RWN51902.1 MAG: hypothetical protein EOR98_23910 [Mesorhizobium sp.]RWN73088.1 MAG: hypothetical protein EOS02_25685 [Mesorhizobium sp.]RWN76271.1 MAG: hypothetical protein EOS01_21405 [Mesorhizobium sp.]RWN86018.1 MAG: hypothetical protein EOS04_20805 [Mesorhizobium sp.]RWO11782.1 MAG: hypothetical protein EOS15_22030 [Mesorhizobium sp.]